MASIHLFCASSAYFKAILVKVHSERSPAFSFLFFNETRLTRRRWSKQFGLSIFVIALLCLCARAYRFIHLSSCLIPLPSPPFPSPALAEFINNWPLKPWPLRKYDRVCPDFHTSRLFRRRSRARCQSERSCLAFMNFYFFVEIYRNISDVSQLANGNERPAAPAKRATIYTACCSSSIMLNWILRNHKRLLQ